VSLVARHLEANGIPTVIIGSAKDIVEHVGVPRYLFSDFPLGNPCGRPHDRGMQREILTMALGLLESARYPRTTVQTPFVWSDDPSWRTDYLNLAHRAELDANRANGHGRGVVVYTSPLCGPCDELKAYLTARGVPFHSVDVLTDPAAAERLRAAGVGETPALEVGGRIVTGLGRERVDRLLGL
jgi:glutaredoxin